MSEEIKATETTEKKAKKAKAEISCSCECEAEAPKKAKKAAAKKPAEKLIKITLVKSTLGQKKDQIATVQALGLKKIRQFNIVKDNAAIRGMTAKVAHLVSVEEVKQEA